MRTEENNKRQYTVIVLVIIGAVFVYLMSVYVIPRALVTLTKAAPATRVSIGNSMVLGQKILADADGKDKCVVNVFLMDNIGKGVKGKRVTLLGMEGIEPEEGMSDELGRVKFEMKSKKAGQFEIEGTVEGVPLGQKVTVTFR